MAESSKTCTECKETLPLSLFHRNSASPDGLLYGCIPCRRKMYKDYRSHNKDKMNLKQQNRRIKLKNEIFTHYGNKCACCGETERAFLAVDHINNDGAEFRKEKRRLGYWFHGWIKTQGFPTNLQLLCQNCNWAKSRGGCPHQNKSILFSNTFIVSTR